MLPSWMYTIASGRTAERVVHRHYATGERQLRTTERVDNGFFLR